MLAYLAQIALLVILSIFKGAKCKVGDFQLSTGPDSKIIDSSIEIKTKTKNLCLKTSDIEFNIIASSQQCRRAIVTFFAS